MGVGSSRLETETPDAIDIQTLQFNTPLTIRRQQESPGFVGLCSSSNMHHQEGHFEGHFLKKTDTERFHIFGCSGSEVGIMDLLFAISFIVKPLNHYSHHVMSFQ